jgi:hypothetical protein
LASDIVEAKVAATIAITKSMTGFSVRGLRAHHSLLSGSRKLPQPASGII